MTESIKNATNYAAETLGLSKEENADLPRVAADSGHPSKAPPEKWGPTGRVDEGDRERGLARDEGNTGRPEMVEDQGGIERGSLGKVPREPSSIGNNTGAVGGAIGGASPAQMAGRNDNNDHGTGIMQTEDGRTTYAPDGHVTRDARREYSDEYTRPGEEGQTGISFTSSAATGAGLGSTGSGTRFAQEGRSQSNVTGTSEHTGSAESGNGPEAPRGSVQDQSGDKGKKGSEDRDEEGSQNQGNESSESKGKEGSNGKGKERSESKAKDDAKDKPSVTRENNDAIPFAGDKKVGSDHWGESKLLKENETSENKK